MQGARAYLTPLPQRYGLFLRSWTPKLNAMTTSTSLSGRNLPPRAPEKGSFPLDHLGECNSLAEMYTACLREHDGVTTACKAIARQYLQCRMETGLMAQEDLSALGMSADQQASTSGVASGDVAQTTSGAERRSDERKGFVAGMRTAKRRRGASGDGAT